MSTSTVASFPLVPSLQICPIFNSSSNSQRPSSFYGLPSSIPLCSASKRYLRVRNRTFVSQPMAELTPVSAYRSSGLCEDGGPAETDAIWNPQSTDFVGEVESSGWEYTINESSKWLMAVLLVGAIVWKHNAEVLWAAMGAIINTWFSIVLKLILKQDRPTPSLRSSPGMPSSHAQSLFFGVVFIIISLFQSLGITILSVILGSLIFMSGSYLSWLRVKQQLHTISQVVVGAVVGTIICMGWMYLWQTVLLEAFNSFLWVRIAVILGSVSFCTAFFLYVTRYWIPRDS